MLALKQVICIAQSYRSTAANTESKFLMLRYAFEKSNCIPAVIGTDALNEVSRKAIEGSGAKQEWVSGYHKI